MRWDSLGPARVVLSANQQMAQASFSASAGAFDVPFGPALVTDESQLPVV